MRYTYEQPEYIDKVGVAHLAQQLKIYIDDIATGDIDLSDYVTKSELQAKLDALDINIDLSAYATKEELTQAINSIDLSAYAKKTDIPDVSGYLTSIPEEYVTDTELNAKGYLTEHQDLSAYALKTEIPTVPSLDGYATQEYVADAINNAQLGGDSSSIDLSIYAKKSDLDSKANTEHTHTMSDITDYTAPDLSSYAKKTDIPSLSGYATKTYVDQNKFSGSYNDLTNKPTIPSIDGLATTEYVDNAVANVPSGGGNVNLSNYYTKEETYNKTEVDTAISNIGVKHEYTNLHGTKLNIEMPQLPTFDGGTVLHITPPDDWSDFINAENDCMAVYMKKDKNREYIDVMNDDIIRNVDSKGHATPTLTIPNTTAGFIDDYVIRGYQYSNNGTISLKSKQTGWLYDYQKIDNNLSCYTKWTIDFGDFASGIDGFRFIFDTSQRTGFVTFDFGQYDCYVDRSGGGIIRKSRNSSFTVDVTNVNTYNIYVPVGTDDNLHMTCPEYTITYPDEITSGTFKIWTSDIDAVNISTQYEFTVNIKQFTDEYYVRYGNEDLVKITNALIPTVTVTKEGKVATITCTDSNGTTTATISDGADGQGGASGITYAYDTEIATGDTYFDDRPIYMRIFHIDALSSAPSNYIVYDNYKNQTPFADKIISAEPVWYTTSSTQNVFTGNVIQSFNFASGSSSSAAITAVNNLLKTVVWVQAWQNSSEFAITVTRGQDMYNYACDIFVKYVKSA